MGNSAVLTVLDRADPFAAPADEPPLDDRDVRDLAAIPDAEQALVAIAADPAATPARRYAAAEALLQGQFEAWRSSSAALHGVAAALAVALRNDTTHNRWGLPGQFTGRLGDQLLALTDGVVDALAGLLDDTSRLRIEGGEAATIDDQAGYRISDLAAYLLTRYRGFTWDAPLDVTQRDAFIDELKAELG